MTLYDTSFIIDLVNSDERAIELANKADEEESVVAISSISVHEYLFGIHYRFHNSANFHEKLKGAIKDLEQFDILPLDHEIAQISAEIHASLVRQGRQIGINDSYIAATALHYGFKLATRNREHFGRIRGLEIIDY